MNERLLRWMYDVTKFMSNIFISSSRAEDKTRKGLSLCSNPTEDLEVVWLSKLIEAWRVIYFIVCVIMWKDLWCWYDLCTLLLILWRKWQLLSLESSHVLENSLQQTFQALSNSPFITECVAWNKLSCNNHCWFFNTQCKKRGET